MAKKCGYCGKEYRSMDTLLAHLEICSKREDVETMEAEEKMNAAMERGIVASETAYRE